MASEGAEIRLEDGASLTIPPGALAADAEVTFSRVCTGIFALREFASCEYTVAGGEWTGRFELSLPTRDEAVAVRDAADGLRPLLDTAGGSGAVRASASRPGGFTSRVSAGAIADDRCADPDFTPCGGDVAGDWVLTDTCGTTEQLGGGSWSGRDPYADCEADAHVADYPFTVSGTIRFDDGGEYELTSEISVVKHEMTTVDCLDTVGETCNADCSVESGVCDCVFAWGNGVGGVGGAWAYGESGTLELDAGSARYCVEGDTLTLELPHDASAYVMVYTRE